MPSCSRSDARVWPDLAEFRSLARPGRLVPVCCEVLADLETPVSAFLKIHRGPYGFLLESVQGGERWGRYSFLGTEPERVLRVRGTRIETQVPGGPTTVSEAADPLTALQDLLSRHEPVRLPGLPRFVGGAVGFLGYDVVRRFERLPERVASDLPMPDAVLLVPSSVVAFDNVAQKLTVVTHVRVDDETDVAAAHAAATARLDDLLSRLDTPVPGAIGASADAAEVRSNVSPEAFQDSVRRAKEYIRAGDVIQVVLSQRFELPLTGRPIDVYRGLRTLNPSPYMFYLALDDVHVAGASPEVMARVEQGEMTVRPIAGTRPRGTTEVDDQALAAELCADPKELAEHVMLLDLGRNDVGRVAEVGTVEVTERFAVERYSHVMHLVSNVRGRLASGRDCYDAFRAAFPAGTLTGAPKIRAMEIIEELEPVRRGLYGGAVGYFDESGAMDTAIAIRTVLMHGGRAYVQAGAGIVADSDPETEHRECVNKARAMLRAVGMAGAMR
jgi:anthranilate synthase component 1